MFYTTQLRFSTFTLLFFFFCTTAILQAQPKFKVGDRVEASYAGDWLRAIITGGFQQNEFGSTYEVKFDGYTSTSRIGSNYVRPVFRADAAKKFQPGESVEFRRWDDALYEGQIIGVDGDRYEIQYTKDGFSSKEWIRETSVRPSPKAGVPATGQGLPQTPAPKVAPQMAAGQKFKIGERVMYDEVGFLTTKSFGTIISYDANKRMYTIRNEKDPSLRYSYACYEVVAPDEKIDNLFFVGTWEVFISGAMTTTKDEKKKTTTYAGGMKLPPLQIKGDGTYTWVTDKNKTIRGRWQPRTGVPGITLLKGIDGLDWTVYENTEADAATGKTRDEIRFHHLPSSSGYYLAYRAGATKSCVLAGRKF